MASKKTPNGTQPQGTQQVDPAADPNAATVATPAQGLKQEAAPPLWGSQIPVKDVIKQLPNWPKQLPKNESGINAYFALAGAQPGQIAQWQGVDTGVADALAWASSKQSAMSSGVESRTGPAGEQAVEPLSEEQIDARIGSIVRAGRQAGRKGGPIKRIEGKITRGGDTEVVIRTRRPGSKAGLVPPAGGPAAGATGGGGAAAPGGSAAGGGTAGGTQATRPDPRTPEGREQIVQASADKIAEKGKKPPFSHKVEQLAYIYGPDILRVLGYGTAGLAAIGAGAYGVTRALSGSDDEKKKQMMPQQQPAGGGLMQMFVPPADTPQAPPQTPAPPQVNPAGAPGKDQTTLLLERMLRSREYA